MSGSHSISEHQVNPCNEGILITAYQVDPELAPHRYDIVYNGNYLQLVFQHGPIPEVGINGVTHEALLAIIADRLRGFQSSPFSCRENALALTKIEEALMWLHKRTRDREARGVEGTLVV